MSTTSAEASTARPAQVAASLARAAQSDVERNKAEAKASLDALAENADTRDKLQDEADKRQLRVALHDLAEGVRGMIRVSPLASVIGGIAFGMMLARRRRRHRV